MRPPESHGSSSSASGTRVVLPAPGGACNTASLDDRSASRTSPSTASIGSGLFGVILGDAAGDELLEELGLPMAIAGPADVRQREPQLLHRDEQLLGVDVLRSRLGGSACENILKFLPVVTSAHCALHYGSKRVERIGLQARRLRPIEGHHEGVGRAMVGV